MTTRDNDRAPEERRHAVPPPVGGLRRRADDLSPSVAQALATITAAIQDQARRAHDRAAASHRLACDALAKVAAGADRASTTRARLASVTQKKPQPVRASRLHLVKKRSA